MMCPDIFGQLHNRAQQRVLVLIRQALASAVVEETQCTHIGIEIVVEALRKFDALLIHARHHNASHRSLQSADHWRSRLQQEVRTDQTQKSRPPPGQQIIGPEFCQVSARVAEE